MDKRQQILKVLPVSLRRIIMEKDIDYEKLREIRLRVNQPVLFVYGEEELCLFRDGTLSVREAFRTGSDAKPFVMTMELLTEAMEYISNFSLYAFEDEIRQGFITIQGGHRVGVAGKIILEQNKIKSMRHISFINIRLSHQVRGCASVVIPYIQTQTGVLHTLIVSPPGGGKTTLLRDLIRQLSNGTKGHNGFTIGVVDERSELGASYLGIPQNDLGERTDLLDCCPKAEGMLLLLRSMSPSVIAVDEIGYREDIEAIEYALNCGCKILATVHGRTIDDLLGKPYLGKMIRERTFERLIFLGQSGGVGHVSQIYDERGTILFESA